MTERNANMLLADTAQPANGIARNSVVQWYGGPIAFTATGDFSGATVDVMMTTKMPAGADRANYADDEAHPDLDFVSLHSFTEPGTHHIENLNPCVLLVKVGGSTADSRVRVTLG